MLEEDQSSSLRFRPFDPGSKNADICLRNFNILLEAHDNDLEKIARHGIASYTGSPGTSWDMDVFPPDDLNLISRSCEMIARGEPHALYESALKPFDKDSEPSSNSSRPGDAMRVYSAQSEMLFWQLSKDRVIPAIFVTDDQTPFMRLMFFSFTDSDPGNNIVMNNKFAAKIIMEIRARGGITRIRVKRDGVYVPNMTQWLGSATKPILADINSVDGILFFDDQVRSFLS